MLKTLISALLFCVLLHKDGTVSATSEMTDGCQQLLACQNEVTAIDMAKHYEAFYFARADGEALCRQNELFNSCVQDKQQGCSNTGRNSATYDIMNRIRVLGYMCSTEGRELLRRVRHTPCATDPINDMQYWGIFGLCFSSSRNSPSDDIISEEETCRILNRAIKCIQNSTEALCGAAMGEFAANIFTQEISQGDYADFGCAARV